MEERGAADQLNLSNEVRPAPPRDAGESLITPGSDEESAGQAGMKSLQAVMKSLHCLFSRLKSFSGTYFNVHRSVLPASPEIIDAFVVR